MHDVCSDIANVTPVLEKMREQLAGMKRALEANEIPTFSLSSAGSEKNWTVIQRSGFKLQPQVWNDELDSQLRAGIADDEYNRLQPKPFDWEKQRTEVNQKEEVSHAHTRTQVERSLVHVLVLIHAACLSRACRSTCPTCGIFW